MFFLFFVYCFVLFCFVLFCCCCCCFVVVVVVFFFFFFFAQLLCCLNEWASKVLNVVDSAYTLASTTQNTACPSIMGETKQNKTNKQTNKNRKTHRLSFKLLSFYFCFLFVLFLSKHPLLVFYLHILSPLN